MTASIMQFPNPTTVVAMKQHIANLPLLPAAGSSLIFMADGKMGAGTVIVALPNGQTMIKVEDNTRHPKAGQKIWIARKQIRTHAIFQPMQQGKPSAARDVPAGQSWAFPGHRPLSELDPQNPDDFPPAAA
jgi:hypothetical protein